MSTPYYVKTFSAGFPSAHDRELAQESMAADVDVTRFIKKRKRTDKKETEVLEKEVKAPEDAYNNELPGYVALLHWARRSIRRRVEDVERMLNKHREIVQNIEHHIDGANAKDEARAYCIGIETEKDAEVDALKARLAVYEKLERDSPNKDLVAEVIALRTMQETFTSLADKSSQ
ncbi:hypothetical protein BDV95DRAFT_615052 [Massariosphaeria phaeospora]|uniref:Uncharacterized protein n=1 Tax=Massariosphaeria phaeospora TaxID=100035 RepID=A0A7C8MH42_9PLEO|nr:hypothetical protein BDV95DRAFT_615052 [Massariosphaeria phaeospora]